MLTRSKCAISGNAVCACYTIVTVKITRSQASCPDNQREVARCHVVGANETPVSHCGRRSSSSSAGDAAAAALLTAAGLQHTCVLSDRRNLDLLVVR